MQLTYRGIQYQYTPAAVESDLDSLVDQYRGSALKLRRAENSLSPALELIYRGNRYTKTANNQPVRPAPLAHSVQLIYRGVTYTTGANASQKLVESDLVEQDVKPDIAEQARRLTLQYRQKADRRERSTLERFEAALNTSAHDWSVSA